MSIYLTLFQLEGADSATPSAFKLFYIDQKIAKLVHRNFVTFLKICLATFIPKNFEKFRISEPLRGQRSAAGIFKKNESSGYITYYVSLESIFFTDFKKKAQETLSYINSYLSRNDIINLVRSKLTHVCEIMTRCTNYDFHRLPYEVTSYILIPKCL